MAAKTTNTQIEIKKITTEVLKITILGRTPLIFNSMTAKAMRDLLLPKGRKTAAEKASSLKHAPEEEFRNSMYIDNENDDVRLYMPAPAFKGAAKTAALDLPGAKKSEVGRLLWIDGERVPIYGIPRMLMSIVRSADMNRTPDVRTRAIVEDWCATLSVSYNTVKLRAPAVANLMAAAGVLAGVGDWRQEKGAGNYGQFEVVPDDDERVRFLRAHAGAAAQDAAIERMEPYNEETRELLEWYRSEVRRRGMSAA